MSVEIVLIFALAVTIVYSLISGRLNKTFVTLPMVFTGLGYLVYSPVEQLAGTDVLHDIARTVAEVTLILVLFADASHVRFARLRENYQIPMRMLTIGMPLTILLGTAVVGILPPDQSWAVALLTAAILTPTDATLGQTVVSSPNVPQRLSQSVNVESGLNDGLALPFILLAAILAGSGAMAETHQASVAVVALKQLVLGPLVGVFIGWTIARALDFAQNKNVISTSSGGVVFLCTAFAAFLLAEEVGGNGFISAFVAGAVFGNVYKHDITFISEFMESQGQLLCMAAFFIFGAVLLPSGIEHMNWIPVAVGILFLTVVRMLPIWIALAGTGLSSKEKLFLSIVRINRLLPTKAANQNTYHHDTLTVRRLPTTTHSLFDAPAATHQPTPSGVIFTFLSRFLSRQRRCFGCSQTIKACSILSTPIPSPRSISLFEKIRITVK